MKTEGTQSTAVESRPTWNANWHPLHPRRSASQESLARLPARSRTQCPPRHGPFWHPDPPRSRLPGSAALPSPIPLALTGAVDELPAFTAAVHRSPPPLGSQQRLRAAASSIVSCATSRRRIPPRPAGGAHRGSSLKAPTPRNRQRSEKGLGQRFSPSALLDQDAVHASRLV